MWFGTLHAIFPDWINLTWQRLQSFRVLLKTDLVNEWRICDISDVYAFLTQYRKGWLWMAVRSKVRARPPSPTSASLLKQFTLIVDKFRLIPEKMTNHPSYNAGRHLEMYFSLQEMSISFLKIFCQVLLIVCRISAASHMVGCVTCPLGYLTSLMNLKGIWFTMERSCHSPPPMI